MDLGRLKPWHGWLAIAAVALAGGLLMSFRPMTFVQGPIYLLGAPLAIQGRGLRWMALGIVLLLVSAASRWGLGRSSRSWVRGVDGGLAVTFAVLAVLDQVLPEPGWHKDGHFETDAYILRGMVGIGMILAIVGHLALSSGMVAARAWRKWSA